MKKRFIVILGVFIMFLSSSCSNNAVKEVTLKEIEMKNNNDLEEVLTDLKNDGIYSLETKKHKYIIFNGSEQEYKTIDYVLNDNTLTIMFTTDKLVESSQVVYELSPFPSDSYDTIKLERNGEETVFQSIYVK